MNNCSMNQRRFGVQLLLLFVTSLLFLFTGRTLAQQLQVEISPHSYRAAQTSDFTVSLTEENQDAKLPEHAVERLGTLNWVLHPTHYSKLKPNIAENYMLVPQGNVLGLMNIKTGRTIKQFPISNDQLRFATARGKTLVTSQRGELIVLDTETGIVDRFPSSLNNRPQSMALSPNGEQLLAHGYYIEQQGNNRRYKRVVRVVDLKTKGSEFRNIELKGVKYNQIRQMAWEQDNVHAILGLMMPNNKAPSELIRVNTITGEYTKIKNPHVEAYKKRPTAKGVEDANLKNILGQYRKQRLLFAGIHVIPDNKHLITASNKGMLIMSALDGSSSRELFSGYVSIHRTSVSPDGKRMAIAFSTINRHRGPRSSHATNYVEQPLPQKDQPYISKANSCIAIINLDPAMAEQPVERIFSAYTLSMAWTKDGQFLAITDHLSPVIHFKAVNKDNDTNPTLNRPGHHYSVIDAIQDHAGNLVTLDNGGSLIRWIKTDSGYQQSEPLQIIEPSVYPRQMLLTASADKRRALVYQANGHGIWYVDIEAWKLIHKDEDAQKSRGAMLIVPGDQPNQYKQFFANSWSTMTMTDAGPKYSPTVTYPGKIALSQVKYDQKNNKLVGISKNVIHLVDLETNTLEGVLDKELVIGERHHMAGRSRTGYNIISMRLYEDFPWIIILLPDRVRIIDHNNNQLITEIKPAKDSPITNPNNAGMDRRSMTQANIRHFYYLSATPIDAQRLLLQRVDLTWELHDIGQKKIIQQGKGHARFINKQLYLGNDQLLSISQDTTGLIWKLEKPKTESLDNERLHILWDSFNVPDEVAKASAYFRTKGKDHMAFFLEVVEPTILDEEAVLAALKMLESPDQKTRNQGRQTLLNIGMLANELIQLAAGESQTLEMYDLCQAIIQDNARAPRSINDVRLTIVLDLLDDMDNNADKLTLLSRIASGAESSPATKRAKSMLDQMN